MDYRVISSLDQVDDALRESPAVVRFLAGGADLMYRIKKGFLNTEKLTLLNINGLDGLRGVVRKNNYLEAGALVTLRDLHSRLQKEGDFSGLMEPLGTAASPQIRSVATVGGHLGGCYPHSHLLPALMVLGASVVTVLEGRRTERDAAGVYMRPYHSSLKKGELIESLRIPAGMPKKFFYWGERPRAAFAFAPFVLSMAQKEDGSVAVAGGGSSFIPRHFSFIEEFLTSGSAGGSRDVGEIVEMESREMGGQNGGLTDYQKTVLRRMVLEW